RRNHAEQKHALYALVDPSSAPPKPVLAGLGWSRRVLPPGPKGLLRRPFIAIAGLRQRPEYRPWRLMKKERVRRPSGGSKTAVLTMFGNLVNAARAEAFLCARPQILIG